MSYNCEPIPNGSSDLPFTQRYLNERMRTRRKRLAMYKQKTPYECLIDFKVAQVKKIQQGLAIRCSPALGRELRRIALGNDLGM